LNKKNKAKKYFEEIKEDYPDSQQSINIDIKLSQVN
jgi:TolA-binding protein